MRFYDFGLGGWLLVTLGAVLAGAPLLLNLTTRSVLAAFGLACAGVGVLLVPYALDRYVFDVCSIGYYALTLASVLLIIAYWRSARRPL